MPSLESKSYIFDPRPHYPLRITAKKYWNPNSPYLHDESAFTLIFAHGTGFHKEQWEPTIDDLAELLGEEKGEKVRVREYWSIDAPNHGDAAVLNEDVLQFGYEPTFQWEEYARAIYTFLINYGTGLDVDLSKRKLVGIGHSMGAVSIMFSQGHSPNLNFHSFLLVDPMIRQHPPYYPASAIPLLTDNFLSQGAQNRRDIWNSKQEAYEAMKARGAWKVWDERVLKIYVEEGMRELPTREYPDKKEGVTLKCTRRQETACYRDPQGFSRAYHLIGPLSKQMPIHLIYGAIDDYIPAEAKEDVIHNASGGKDILASVRRVPNSGHLIPQVNPKGLAKAIYESLAMDTTGKPQAARL